MLRSTGWIGGFIGATCVTLLASNYAQGGSHLWRLNEFFTNADGTIQFIELKESLGAAGETGLLNKTLVSTVTGNVFTIPANLIPPTSNKYLLFATSGFAALPGAPTPDYILPSGFFAINGDTVKWAPQFNYDTFTFGAGVMPTGGVDSLQITNYTTHTYTTGANSPTNYGGQSGSVYAGPPPTPTVSGLAMTVSVAGVLALGAYVTRQRAATSS